MLITIGFKEGLLPRKASHSFSHITPLQLIICVSYSLHNLQISGQSLRFNGKHLCSDANPQNAVTPAMVLTSESGKQQVQSKDLSMAWLMFNVEASLCQRSIRLTGESASTNSITDGMEEGTIGNPIKCHMFSLQTIKLV